MANKKSSGNTEVNGICEPSSEPNTVLENIYNLKARTTAVIAKTIMKTWESLILEPKDKLEGEKKVVLTVGQMTYPFIFTIKKKEKKTSLS